MDPLYMLAVMAAAVAGAVFRRWFGGGFFSAPRALRVAAGVALALIICLPGAFLGRLDVLWCAIVAVIVGAAWVPGHGSYQDMSNSGGPATDNEFLAPLLDRLFGLGRPSVTRRLVGMIIRYALFTVPAGVALAIAGAPAGLLYIGAAGLVGLGYWSAWRLAYRSDAIAALGPTTIGELVAGAVIYGGLAAVL